MNDPIHSMEYAGLVDTRAVWRCVNRDCEFSYSRQLTEEERQKRKRPEEEPETDFPGDWERVESDGRPAMDRLEAVTPSDFAAQKRLYPHSDDQRGPGPWL